MSKRLEEAISESAGKSIRQWVRLTGRLTSKTDAPWLDCPMGHGSRIGSEFYAELAERQNLKIELSQTSGLLPDFDALKGRGFDPSQVCKEVRHFYEHTACYRLEAWSEAAIPTRIFLWGLTRFVSREMNQLNFPISSLELARGMSSEIIPMQNLDGKRVYTGWLRRLAIDDRVIYTGLYSIETLPGLGDPCIKVSFPLPGGSSTVFLRPEARPDGSLTLISSGSKFGDTGFYRMVEVKENVWRVKHLSTLRENFHVYLDKQGILRTDHIVKCLGFTPLKLHYRLERISE